MTALALRIPQEASAPDSETALRLALLAYMAEFGFTALKVTYTRLEGEVARTHRLELAREGWIA